MKKTEKMLFLLVGLTLVLIVSAGCEQLASNTGITPSPTAIPSSSVNSPLVTSTAAVKLTTTPANTPTAIPTLAEEQAHARLLDLLISNSGCQLPCLWGITPGKSKNQEAQGILAPLSGISESWLTGFRSDGGSIAPNYNEGNKILLVNVNFLSENQVVSRISFKAREANKVAKDNDFTFQDIFDSSIFGKRVHPYMLSQVLSEQGIPTAVLMQTLASPVTRNGGTTVGGFEIVLLYPDQGLLIHYTTQIQLSGANVRGCPANAQVELELFPSGKGDSFSKFLAPTEWSWIWPLPPDNPFWKSVEKATSMSLEQFYETYRQPTDKCIETPAKIWPTPAP